MEPFTPGLFGPTPRNAEEQRNIDEHPGVLDEQSEDDADTQNDSQLHPSDVSLTDEAKPGTTTTPDDEGPTAEGEDSAGAGPPAADPEPAP